MNKTESPKLHIGIWIMIIVFVSCVVIGVFGFRMGSQGLIKNCVGMYEQYGQSWVGIQKAFEKNPIKYARLDGDNDGIACEQYRVK